MTNISPQRSQIVAELKTLARDTDTDIWQDVADRLEKPRRTHAEVNLSRIERYARENETVVVPGKVLGSGVLSKSLTIAAVDFSNSAITKIKQANGDPIPLIQAVEEHQDGTNIRLIK